MNRLFASPCLCLLAVEDPVGSGRSGLNHWWRYPWYDSASDGIQRIDVTPPSNPANLSWLARLIAWLFEWGIYITLALILAALIYVLVRAYLERRRRPRASLDDDPRPDLNDDQRIQVLPLPLERGRTDLLGEARRNYEQGNYGRAIVYLFGFQLVQLDRQQIIRLAIGKTNRQYLREVGPPSALGRLLEETMVAFEDVFFGNRRLDRDRFEACWSRLPEFEMLSKQR